MDAPRTQRRDRRRPRARDRIRLAVIATALCSALCCLACASTATAAAVVKSIDAKPSAFVPDWDGHHDQSVIRFTLGQRSHVVVRIVDARGRIVASADSGVLDAGTRETTWDGRDAHGRVLAPGAYRVRIDATPASPAMAQGRTNAARATSREVIITLQRPTVTLTRVQLSRTAIGKATRSASTSARFTLSRRASVSAAIVDSNGAVIRSLASGGRPAGVTTVSWNGRASNGARVADGMYELVVAATGGGRPTTTSRVPVRVDLVPPTFAGPTRVTATVAGSVVTIPLGLRASEDGTVLVRFGRRTFTVPVSQGANTVKLAGTKLGIVATAAARTVSVRVLLRDGAGNASSRTVDVKVPARARVVTSVPPSTGSGGGSDNGSTTPASGSWPWPTIGVVTSEFGKRWGRMHEGVDIGAATGTPIHPAIAGTVAFVGSYGGYGNLVIVDHGGGITTRYGHMSRFGSFAVGTRVSHDDVIGYVGCTGSCTGPHLHFEVRVNDVAKNPRGYLVAS